MFINLELGTHLKSKVLVGFLQSYMITSVISRQGKQVDSVKQIRRVFADNFLQFSIKHVVGIH